VSLSAPDQCCVHFAIFLGKLKNGRLISAIECPKRQPSASFRILGCNWPIVVGRHLKTHFFNPRRRCRVLSIIASALPRLFPRAGCMPRDRSTFPGLDSLC
jgi:hypothetical protein